MSQCAHLALHPGHFSTLTNNRASSLEVLRRIAKGARWNAPDAVAGNSWKISNPLREVWCAADCCGLAPVARYTDTTRDHASEYGSGWWRGPYLARYLAQLSQVITKVLFLL